MEIIMPNIKAGAVMLITLVVLYYTAFPTKNILIFSRLLDLLIDLLHSKKKLDILDIFAAKLHSNLHFYTKNILDLNSDLSAVLLTISTMPLAHTKPPKLFSTLTDHIKFQGIVMKILT